MGTCWRWPSPFVPPRRVTPSSSPPQSAAAAAPRPALPSLSWPLQLTSRPYAAATYVHCRVAVLSALLHAYRGLLAYSTCLVGFCSPVQLPAVPKRASSRGSTLLPAALSLPVSATGLVATMTGPGVRADGTMPRRSLGAVQRSSELAYRGLETSSTSGGGGGGTGEPALDLPCVSSLCFTADSRHLVAATGDAR